VAHQLLSLMQTSGNRFVVNNAGIMVRRKILEVDLKVARKIFDVNVIGATLFIRRCTEHLLPGGLDGKPRQAPGRIIVITSVHESPTQSEEHLSQGWGSK